MASNDVIIKKDYLYTETHEWVKVEENFALIGITDYAQKELGDIVYVELPEVGEEIDADDAFGNIEAVKAVEDIVSPLTGEIVEVNSALEDEPELINNSPYGEGWIIKIKIDDKKELEDLLTAAQYEEQID